MVFTNIFQRFKDYRVDVVYIPVRCLGPYGFVWMNSVVLQSVNS